MKDTDNRDHLPVRHVSVHAAKDFRVTHGVNEGDALSDASDLIADDTYELSRGAAAQRLAVAIDAEGGMTIAPATEIGTSGAPVFFDSLVTFMSPSGETLEAIIFVEVDAVGGMISQVHLHALSPILPKTPYALVTIDRENARRRFAESATVAFTRGTCITMASGRQVPVEDLQPGDRVLTRDSGAQEVRWVGIQTVRAEGAFAPIRIAENALNNYRPLTVSPNHRLFIYQRIDALGAGQRELLVKAGLLVNGTTVTKAEGGFVDYVQLLFDKHEIIYAEGIASESLFIDTTARQLVPEEIAKRMIPERHRDYPLGAVELREGDLLRRHDVVAILKRVSAV